MILRVLCAAALICIGGAIDALMRGPLPTKTYSDGYHEGIIYAVHAFKDGKIINGDIVLKPNTTNNFSGCIIISDVETEIDLRP